MDVLIEDDDYRGSFDPRLWRRILEHLRPFRRQWVGLCVTGVILAVFDVFFPLLTAWLIDEAVRGGGITPKLVGLFVAYIGITVVFCILIWRFIRLAGEVATGVAFDVRTKCFAHLQELDFSFFDHRPVGWLVTRLTSDTTKVSDLIPWCFLDFAWGGSFVVGMAIAMFWLDWQLALVVLVIVPPLVVVSLIFQRKMLASSRATRKSNSIVTASFNECIMGVRTTKSLVREERNGSMQPSSTCRSRKWRPGSLASRGPRRLRNAFNPCSTSDLQFGTRSRRDDSRGRSRSGSRGSSSGT